MSAERSMVQTASRAAHRLERDVVAGVDKVTLLLLSPLAIDFRGWSFGDQGEESWL